MFRPLSLILGLFVVTGFLTGCASDPILAAKQDLCWFTPKGENLNNNAIVSGKIIVVYRSGNYEKGKYGECDLDGYSTSNRLIEKSESNYFPEELYAKSPEEIDTLIMIENKKGRALDPRTVRQSISRQSDVDVFSGITEISLIDHKTGMVLRKTSHENTVIPKSVSEDRLKLNPAMRYEYVVEPSVNDLRSYLREVSDKVKPA
jgi:hypothetical protein